MAVPKKRRIGSKLLNRGFKNRVLYSNMFKLTMSRLSLPYLTRVSDSHNLTSLKNRQLPISFGLVVTKKPAKEPGGKEITIVSMRRFFYTRPATFSPKALRLGFGNGSGIAPWQGGNTLTGAGNVDVDFWPIGLARRVSYTRHPYINSNFLFLYPSLNFLLKRSFFLSQVPHKWGSQKNLLLKKWELSPKHLFLTPVYEMSDTAFELHLGAIRIAHPKNLSTPRGPSLRDL